MNLRKACLLGCKLFYSYLRPSTPYLFTVVKIYIYIYIYRYIYNMCIYIHIYLQCRKEMGRRGLRFAISTVKLFAKTLFSFSHFQFYVFIHSLAVVHFFCLVSHFSIILKKKSRFYETFMKYSWFAIS